MKPVLIFTFLLSLAVYSYAQPAVQWQKAYGSIAGDEGFRCIQQTYDGGYIAISSTTAGGEDVKGHHDAGPNGFDVWVVKIDSKGVVSWAKCYGGTKLDMGVWIEQTADTGYIFCGYTQSNDGDVSGNHGTTGDVWVAKLDDTGKIEWQKCIGGTSSDVPAQIKALEDGYVIAASSSSSDGDVTGGNKGATDLWVLRLDLTGDIVWQKTLGGAGYENAAKLLAISDGSFLVSAYTNSSNGDIATNKGDTDGWLVKFSSTGSVLWKKTYGGNGNDHLYQMIELPSTAGFVIVGQSTSTNGDIKVNRGGNDVWVLKIDAGGTVKWSKTYGGSLPDYGSSVVLGVDKNYIVASSVSSADSQVSGMKGLTDGWLMALDEDGSILWQRPYGGSAADNFEAIIKTTDGGLAAVGTTKSEDGDALNSGYHKGNTKTDGWIVKLDVYAVGGSVKKVQNDNAIIVYPTVTTGNINVKLPEDNHHATIKMTDMLGREVPVSYQQSGNHVDVALGMLPPSIYLLHVVIDNGTSTYKVEYRP